MTTSKFDELVNLITRQVMKKLEGRDRIEFGSDKKTSGYSAGDLGYDPINTGDELEVSPELDTEIKNKILHPDDEYEDQETDEDETDEDETDEDEDWRKARARKLKDGFKMMRGEED